jgi:hypothetical protein
MKMARIITTLAACAVLAGCAHRGGDATASADPKAAPVPQGVHDLTLQYRIWQDAVAPSQFVAVFPAGMTMGLRIDWRLTRERQAELDARLAELEKNGPNGRTFRAKGKWIVPGHQLEVYEIEEKLDQGIGGDALQRDSTHALRSATDGGHHGYQRQDGAWGCAGSLDEAVRAIVARLRQT